MKTPDELTYLKSIVPSSPGPDFNDDRAVFAHYCNMQVNLHRHDHNVAAQIANIRDRAVPTYRQQAAALDIPISGIYVPLHLDLNRIVFESIT